VNANASASAKVLCHYDVQEKETSFEVVKKACPNPCGGDSVGNAKGTVTQGESKAMGIYAGEISMGEICVAVACFPGNHAEGIVSRIAGGEEVGMVNAKMGGDGEEKVGGAWHGVQDFCCVSRAAARPPRAFSDDPSPVFLAPIFPSVLQVAFVPPPVVARVLPFLLSASDAALPVYLC
jgi:hypothetical protein